MNILVTGGAGFIGSHTVDRLIEEGHSVRVLDSLTAPVHPLGYWPDYMPEGAQLIRGNVNSPHGLLRALEGIEVVFHLAAFQDNHPEFSKYAAVNDVSTALLYETIVQHKLPVKKVIIASSQAVYGEGKHYCDWHGIVYPPMRGLYQLERGSWEVRCPDCDRPTVWEKNDESRVNPSNAYAVSKYCQELYALTLGRQYAIPTVALRYSITQGPRQSIHNAYSGILRIFTQRLLNGLSPVIYEDGHQMRDYVYVGDVVEANILVMESEEANYQVFNVGGGKAVSVDDYAACAIVIAGSDALVDRSGEFRFGDSRHMVSDSSKLERLGWRRTLAYPEIIAEYMAWAGKQGNIPPDYSDRAIIEMKDSMMIRTVKHGT